MKRISNGGKLFAGFYALYSGLAFIAIMSIMLYIGFYIDSTGQDSKLSKRAEWHRA